MILDILLPLWLFLVRGDNAISESDAFLMVEDMAASYRQAGINLQLKHFEIIDDMWPEENSVMRQSNRLIKSMRWAKKKGYGRPRRVILFVYPRFPTGHIAGLSFRCAYRSRRPVGIAPVGISNATKYNPMGDYRIPHSKEAMRHEILHVMGAKHFETSVNLMHPNPLPFVDEYYPLEIESQSLNEVIRCMKKPKGRF